MPGVERMWFGDQDSNREPASRIPAMVACLPSIDQTAVNAWRRQHMPKQSMGIRLPLAAFVVLGVIGGDFLVRQSLNAPDEAAPEEAAPANGWWTPPAESQRDTPNTMFSERAFETESSDAPGVASVPGLFSPDPNANAIQYFPVTSPALANSDSPQHTSDQQTGRAVISVVNVDESEAATPESTHTSDNSSNEQSNAESPKDVNGVPPTSAYPTPQSDPGQQPQELPQAQHASPIADRRAEADRKAESSTRDLIGRELPHLSQDDQQIWQETLQGLPPDMIRELLQFRRQAPINDSDLPHTPKTPVPPPRVSTEQLPGLPHAPLQAPPRLADQDSMPSFDAAPQQVLAPLPTIPNTDHGDHLVLLRQAVNIVAKNIVNAATPGFKAADVMPLAILEPPTSNGTHSHRLHVGNNMTQGALQQTGRPLDLAIVGQGFFEVTNDNRTYYARYGRLSKNCDGDLCLRYGQQDLMLQPPINIPSDIVRIVVNSDGAVLAWHADDDAATELGSLQLTNFPNPDGLERRGMLFQTSERSGPPQTSSPNQQGAGRVHQGFLESSNVDIEDQLRTLHRFQRMAGALQQLNALEPAMLAPIVDPSRLTTHDRDQPLKR